MVMMFWRGMWGLWPCILFYAIGVKSPVRYSIDVSMSSESSNEKCLDIQYVVVYLVNMKKLRKRIKNRLSTGRYLKWYRLKKKA